MQKRGSKPLATTSCIKWWSLRGLDDDASRVRIFPKEDLELARQAREDGKLRQPIHK